MTLTKRTLILLVKKWYSYTLSDQQVNTILTKVNEYCEEYELINESELCDIIGDVIYAN